MEMEFKDRTEGSDILIEIVVGIFGIAPNYSIMLKRGMKRILRKRSGRILDMSEMKLPVTFVLPLNFSLSSVRNPKMFIFWNTNAHRPRYTVRDALLILQKKLAENPWIGWITTLI